MRTRWSRTSTTASAGLLELLDEHELRDNTIVIFLTDNGPNSARYNGDMRGRKGSVHEGGVRVPCFISWPRQLEPRLVRTIAAHIDLLPTLAELCGLDFPETKPLDGINLAPILRSTGQAIPANWPNRRLFTYRSTKDGQGRDVLRGAVRTQHYRFIRERGEDQLFDMQDDSSQTKNIAANEPDVFRHLQSKFDEWLTTVVPDETPREPIPVGYAAAPRIELPSVEARFAGSPRFHNSNGFAHDWITGWNKTTDRIWWELNVVNAGEYVVTLSYACRQEDIGSRVQMSVIHESTPPKPTDTARFTITDAFDTGKIARTERDQSKGPRWMREYRTLKAGRVQLPEGRIRLELKAVEIPGGTVCELDALRAATH